MTGPEISVPLHTRRYIEGLRVDFRAFVGEQTGRPDLVSPDFVGEYGMVNPGWIDATSKLSRRLGDLNLIKLKKIEETGEWVAADPSSPIGQIAALREEASIALGNPLLSEQDRKGLEQRIRRSLADIYNGYAGERFNGMRDISDGRDFAGVNIRNFAYRSLLVWRQDLLDARRWSVDLTLFDHWEPVRNKSALKTPTHADHFIFTLFQELSSTKDDSRLSLPALRLKILLTTFPPALSYRQIADAFYAGDMLKVYINFSALAKMTGQSMPEGWQKFHGSTKEFRDIEHEVRLHNFREGIDGYLETANDLYSGDMAKTYKTISAVAQMTGQAMPKGWQEFHGFTTEFRDLQSSLQDFREGIDGYLEAADRLYRGDMQKTHINLSAVAHMTGRSLPDGWQEFKGSTTNYAIQRQWIDSHPSYSAEDFAEAFHMNKNKARDNLAAMDNMERARLR